MTESAAELYVSHGLYSEALDIYQHLNQAGKGDHLLDKISDLQTKILNQKKIRALSTFLKIIQERGN